MSITSVIICTSITLSELLLTDIRTIYLIRKHYTYFAVISLYQSSHCPWTWYKTRVASHLVFSLEFFCWCNTNRLTATLCLMVPCSKTSLCLNCLKEPVWEEMVSRNMKYSKAREKHHLCFITMFIVLPPFASFSQHFVFPFWVGERKRMCRYLKLLLLPCWLPNYFTGAADRFLVLNSNFV